MAKRAFTNVVYTSDKGKTYAYKIASDIFAQVDGSSNPKVGGSDLNVDTLDPMPQNFKPRHAIMRRTGEGFKKVVILNPAGSLYTNPAETIDLPVYHSANSLAFTRYKLVGESYRDKNPDV